MLRAINSVLRKISRSRHIVIALTILLNSTISIPLDAQSPSSIPDPKVVDEFLQNTVASFRIPGLAVAIVSDEQVVFASGYGEASPGVDVTPTTPFLLGSTTKTFTALAVMRLVEQGKVELDSPVEDYVPEFQLAVPGSEEGITVRHLLNHTSGLSDKCMPGTTWGEDSLEEELANLRGCVPDSAPGERYAYFNVNYRLLGLVIERVSGMEFGEFLSAEIFEPLSMTSTFAGPDGVEGLAYGHGQIFNFPFPRNQEFRPGAVPSGYLVSSASDLARFLIAEIQAGSGNPGPLDPETVKATWSSPGSSNEEYAMGWLVVHDEVNGRVLGHGGALENYQSFFYINPQSRLGFVILANQGGLFPMSLGFAAVRDGLLSIVNGEQPESGPRQWPIVIVTAIFCFGIGIAIFRTLRLKAWELRAARQKPWRRWLGVCIELIWPCFLLFGLIPFMNPLMGDKADWAMIYGLSPELFFLLVVSIGLGFFRGVFKIWRLTSNIRNAA